MNWISVGKRLPKKSEEEYIVCNSAGIVTTMDFVAGKWYSDILNKFVDNVTHWMPLPDEPPKN